MNACRPSGSGAGYRCGAIEIDATQRQVLIDGAPARIGARAFAVLLALVERRERVVSKQELMDLVWPRLVVEENNLLVHMVALRKILGPQAIATTPGRGYRFALPVEEVNGRADEPASTSADVPGNLPPSPPLFGRAQDLEAVEALLREHPVVSIVGAAHRQDAPRLGGGGIHELRACPWTLVGRACADHRRGASPEHHRERARATAALRPAARGGAGHGARQPTPAARARQL